MNYIEIWIAPNGIAYTEPMLNRKAKEYAHDFPIEAQEEIIKNILSKWIKNYDHQTLWLL